MYYSRTCPIKWEPDSHSGEYYYLIVTGNSVFNMCKITCLLDLLISTLTVNFEKKITSKPNSFYFTRGKRDGPAGRVTDRTCPNSQPKYLFEEDAQASGSLALALALLAQGNSPMPSLQGKVLQRDTPPTTTIGVVSRVVSPLIISSRLTSVALPCVMAVWMLLGDDGDFACLPFHVLACHGLTAIKATNSRTTVESSPKRHEPNNQSCTLYV